MNKTLQTLATLALLLVANFSFAQRYLDEVFTDDEITVVSDVTYATNIDFLTSDLTPSTQLATDLGTLSALADGGADYPAAYYDPADASTQVKVTDVQMDIYHPDNGIDTETSRPVMVYLHTGNFLPPPINGSMMGRKADSLAVDLCRSWARRGYVAVSVNYRLRWNPLGDENTRRSTLLNAVYRALQDTKMAVRAVRDNASTYGIDVDKIALFGEGSGGYIAQAYTTLDNPGVELFLEKFLPDPFDPTTSFVDTLLVGLPSGVGFPNSLNLYRASATSADVQMSINAGGALADESWLEAGDVPMVSFHAVRDNFAPFTEGTVIVPTTQEEVVDVHGSNFFIQKANDLGNNAVFAGLPDGDPYTDRARSLYSQAFDAVNPAPYTETVNATPEGLFPIVQPLQPFLTNISAPWQWWDPNAPLSQVEVAPGVTTHLAQLQSNPNMSEAQSMAFQDTINGYLLPRLTCALNLPGNPCLPPAPENDAFCDAIDIAVDGGPVSTDNTDATPDGPQAACWFDEIVENDIWFTFTAPASGGVSVETIDTGGNDDTQVAIYSSSDGTCAGDTTLVACNDDISGTDYMCYVEVSGLTVGDVYWVQVDGWEGTDGAFDIEINSLTPSLDPCPDPGAIICDNFDEYALGPDDFLTADHWVLWPAATVIPSNIVNTRAFSNSQSMKLGVGPDEDPVLDLGNNNSGVFSADWMMYIPSDSTAYYNAQAVSPVDGGDWVFHVFFETDGTLELRLQDGATVFASGTFPQDEWFSVEHVIDLDNDNMELTIAGTVIASDYVYDEDLGGINFYANGALNTYYLDDVIINGTADGLLEYTESAFSIYPNPTESTLTIAGEEQIDAVIVRDVLGAVVRQLNSPYSNNLTIDLSDLTKGVYFVEVRVDDIVNVSRVIKK